MNASGGYVAASNAASGGEGEADAVEQLVVWPHRSLGRRGTQALMGCVGVVFALIGIWALRVGAWPLFIYAALAMGGFAWALCCNNRVARFAQVIEFTPEKIRVCEIGPASRSAQPQEFNPFWVRIIDAAGPAQNRRLLMRQSGRSVSIGDFLSVEERAELAVELRERIARRYFSQVSRPS